MTGRRPTAEERREELEALLWQHKAPPALVAKILAAADAYAKASRPPVPKKLAKPKKPPAVHYRLPKNGRPSCRAHAFMSTVTGWAVTPDTAAVTCEHCRKSSPWQQAAEAGGDP